MVKFGDVLKATFTVTAIALFACFALGVFDGEGISTVHEKDYEEFTFSGNLRNGRFTGIGSMSFQDGQRYSGNFALGRFEGEGTMYSPLPAWSFNGFFQEGRIGSGVFHDQDDMSVAYERGETADTLIGNTWVYEGGLNEHGQNGTGSFTFADGSVYTGGFLRGLAEGEGFYVRASGEVIYIGDFKEGRFDGQGRYTSPEGWSYEGSFKEGLFDGEGILIAETGIIRGVWEKGVQVTRHG